MAKKRSRPKRAAVPAPLRPPRKTRPARTAVATRSPRDGTNYRQVLAARELFWNNVIREMLTSLSVLPRNAPPALPPGSGADGAPATDNAPTTAMQPLFDGRLAVITKSGARLPIAEVFPLLACGVPTSDTERELAIAVECTVFQIRTPSGEIFTLPLHEIRGFHALSEDVMDRLEEATRRQGSIGPEELEEPFGFAAFTSLARTKNAPPPDDAPI
jgi:hypothetical protein